MAKTNISWATHSWNPTVGCSKVSEGCRHCYAEITAQRLKRMGRPEYQAVVNKHGWTGEIAGVPKRLNQRFPKGSRVFVDSMSDLFHESLPPEIVGWVFEAMAEQPDVTYLVLTKRPARALWWFEWLAYNDGAYPSLYGARNSGGWPLPNVWLGVSAENQERADERTREIIRIAAAVRFLSVEPMLGPVDLCEVLMPDGDHLGRGLHNWGSDSGIDWVIAGAESGPKRRPFDVQWAVDLYEQCREGGVKFFGKQDSGLYPGKPLVLGEYGMVQEWPGKEE